MIVEQTSAHLATLVAPEATVEEFATGVGFIEGPVGSSSLVAGGCARARRGRG